MTPLRVPYRALWGPYEAERRESQPMLTAGAQHEDKPEGEAEEAAPEEAGYRYILNAANQKVHRGSSAQGTFVPACGTMAPKRSIFLRCLKLEQRGDRSYNFCTCCFRDSSDPSSSSSSGQTSAVKRQRRSA